MARSDITLRMRTAMARSDSNIAHENTTAGDQLWPGAIVTLRMRTLQQGISYGQER